MLLALSLTWSLMGAATAGQATPPPPTIRGAIVDARTGAPIADAQVTLVELSRSVETSADGGFAFTQVPVPGEYTLTVSRIGYIFVRRQVTIGDAPLPDLTIPVAEGTGTYQESVTVTPPPVASEIGVGSRSDLGSAALQDLRSVAADDPMRAVQALPGVATGDDFQSQFSVRGSEFRHVGIVLDGTATPLLLHTVRSTNDTASIAMINTDVLDRASLLAGPHPQRHGDWLGATLDFDLREGSRDRVGLRGAVSATSASAVVEGPLGRSKRGAWVTSVRKSYIDWLIRKIYPEIDSTLGFTDMQSKAVYDVSDRQQLQFTVIAGRTAYRNDRTSLANGIKRAISRTVLGSLAWRYTRRSALTTQRVSYVGAHFSDLGRVDQELGSGTGTSLVWRGDASWFAGGSWTLEGGGKVERQHQNITQRNFSVVAGRPVERFAASSTLGTDLSSAWGHLSRRTPRGGVSIGARLTNDSRSRRTVSSPWLMAERVIGPLTLRASAGAAHQFPELELQRGLPERVPERAQLADLGVEGALPHGMRWQATGFWRHEVDVLRRSGEDRLVGGARIVESVFPEFSSSLDGRTRGVDLLFGRRSPNGLTGWVAYTYAKTREHDRVTLENFDGDFDQRHTVNVFVQERLSYRTAISAKLRIGSNFPLVGYFSGSLDDLRLGSDRNQVRLPRYARLDLRANRTFTFDRRRLTLFVEVVNVTDHNNVGQNSGFFSGSAFTAQDFTQELLPFLPSVGLLVEF